MAMWLYQLNHETTYSIEHYRRDIWENERWRWPVNTKDAQGKGSPAPGDTIVTFYAAAGCPEPGFYGWTVVIEWREGDECPLHFRPAAPSDQLKMHPWWDGRDGGDVKRLADKVRRGFYNRTLYRVEDEDVSAIRAGIARWIGWASHPHAGELAAPG